MLDSVNKAVEFKDGYYDFLTYSFWKEYYYSLEIKDSNKLYNDSIIYAIERGNLTKKLAAEYANALNNKGNNYYENGELSFALDYYFRSRSTASKLGDSCLISDQTYHMGMISYRQERYGDAANYFKQALAGNNACRDWKMVFYRRQELLTNVGLSYSNLHVSDSASQYFEKALAYVDSFAAGHADDTDIAKFARKAKGLIYGDLGTELMENSRWDESEAYLKKSMEVNSYPVFDTLSVTYGRLELARIATRKNRLDEAAYLLKQVDSQYAGLPGRRIPQERLSVHYEYYKKKGDVPNALLYLEKANHYRDSISTKVLELRQDDYPQLLKSRESEYDLTLLKKDNEVKQLSLWVTLGVIALAIFVVVQVVVNYRRSARSVAKLTLLNERVKEQNAQQEKTMADLEQSNRDMDRILHVVAHDLRSPVSAAMMMCEIMADEITDPSHKEILEMIVNSSKSQLLLISELMEYSGEDKDPSKLIKEPVEINELCRQVVGMLYFNAEEKDQYINVSVLSEELMVVCAKEKISRVLSNLLTNAIKFSPKGGAIGLTITKGESSVILAIKDAGIGIPEKNKAILFDAFTKAKRTGTSGEKTFGLGLSICKQIVEAHRGKIWFESEEGKGSTFFVELPLNPA